MATQRTDTGPTQAELVEVMIRGLETIHEQKANARSADQQDNLGGPVCFLVYWGIEAEAQAQ